MYVSAGYGGVTVVVEGPHRSELDYEEIEPRKYKVMFSPHEPGIYILNIRFADEHVNGKKILTSVFSIVLKTDSGWCHTITK